MSSLSFKKIMNHEYILVLVLCIQIGSLNSTFRRHKVHNIVLYPDKHSWCTSTPIKQIISNVDCDSVEINNRVCLGACFSYSIPRTLTSNNADEINSYCDSCQPIKTLWTPVTLTCSNGLNHTKHVQLIKDCRCSSCNRHWELEDPLTDEVQEEEISIQTSRYLDLMKLEQDENTEEEEINTTDVPNIEILNALKSTRKVNQKNIWIQGPHHSKVLLRKEMPYIPNISNDDTQQYLDNTTADSN